MSSKLVACPFCRELFTADEGHHHCPECGGGDEIQLVPLEKLPPSPETEREEQLAEGEPLIETSPLDQPLPWHYAGRNRAALAIVALLGLSAFFAPWVDMTMPELQTLSGYDLARGRLGYLWGGGVAFFTLLPLVSSRRSVNQMRGVRVICALFSAVTLSEVILLVALPPTSRVPVQIDWAWGLYLSGLLSIVGIGLSARFGGSAEDLRDLPTPPRATTVSTGSTLH